MLWCARSICLTSATASWRSNLLSRLVALAQNLQRRPPPGPPRACWITTCSALPISSASPAVDDKSLSIHCTTQLIHTHHHTQPYHLYPPISNTHTLTKMPPKAQKTPTTGGKAPAGKAPAEKKEAGKKTAAPAGDKKKRTKTRKETYSSYIYKGEFARLAYLFGVFRVTSAIGSFCSLLLTCIPTPPSAPSGSIG